MSNRGQERGDYTSRGFRISRRSRIPYETQGYIYFSCLCYEDIPPMQQRKIRQLCKQAGGEYSSALFEYLTSGERVQKIADKYFLSPATLYRLRKKFFESW